MWIGVPVVIGLAYCLIRIKKKYGIALTIEDFKFETQEDLYWLTGYGSVVLLAGFLMRLSWSYLVLVLIAYLLVVVILLMGLMIYEKQGRKFLILHEVMMQCAHYYPYSQTLFQTLIEVKGQVPEFCLDEVVNEYEVLIEPLSKLSPHYLWRTLIQTLSFAQISGYHGIKDILSQYERDVDQSLEDMVNFQKNLKRVRFQMMILSMMGCGVGAVSHQMMPGLDSGGFVSFIFLITHLLILVWSWRDLFLEWDLKEYVS